MTLAATMSSWQAAWRGLRAPAWRLLLWRAGPAGIAAAVLSVLALAMAVAVPALRHRADDLRAALATRAATAARPGPAPLQRLPVGEQVNEYVAAFPPPTQRVDDLAELFASAERHKLQLLKGDYQYKQDAKAPLATWSATFPVRGDYAALKAFAADVLRQRPHASLDELHMARTDANALGLEAVVRFTFVYRVH